MPIVVGGGINIGPGITLVREVGPGMDPTGTSNVTIVSQSPFAGGGNSYSFTGGTNSYLWYDGSSATAFGTGDFTVEWFQYQTDNNVFPRPWWYSNITGAISYLGLSFEGASTSATVYYWPSILLLTSIVKSTYRNLWTHFALVRISGTTSLYQNGVSLVSFSDSTNITNTTGRWYIGGKGTGSTSGEGFGGFITNHRVCKGVGVYTGNFTVPTTPLQQTQSAGTNINAITAGQCSILMAP